MPSVTVRRVRVPFRAPFVSAAATWRARDSWLVRVEVASGRTGWGEAVLDDEAERPVLEALLDDVVATGLAPAPALVSRAGAAGRALRAALEGAAADLRDPDDVGGAGVGVNATIGALDLSAVVEAASAAVAAGFRTLKLKTSREDTTASIVERVASVRAAAGDETAIRLDINGGWDLATATERLRALAGFGLQYAEQPLAPGDVEDAVALRSRVGVPIAADEAVESLEAAGILLDAGAADVLVVKPSRVGGAGVVEAIAGLAAERGVPVVVSSLFETGIGLAAALACAGGLPDVPGWPARERDHGLATSGLLVDDLLVDALRVERGRMRPPRGPRAGGLGVTVDEAAVRQFAVDAR